MTREWAVLLYLGGDNSLEDRCLDDLRELKAVGSSETVAVVAQIDRMSTSVTRRYFVRADSALAQDVVQELPEINTGDPSTLVDFVYWATNRYPARRTALILGSHGTGWKDEDIYGIAASVNSEPVTMSPTMERSDDGPSFHRALFLSSVQQVLSYPVEERALMFDDTSRDFLDSFELRQALCWLAGELGRPFDLIGFDACLMSSLEIAFQLQQVCQVMVGSQDNEPGSGWPYEQILGRLAAAPDANPERLGETIVAAFTERYHEAPGRGGVSLSAIRNSAVAALAAAVDVLADRLIDELASNSTFLVTLMSIQRHVTRFSDRDQIDLLHLARLLAERSASPRLQEAATDVARLIEIDSATTAVVAVGQTPTSRAAGATGRMSTWPNRIAGGLSLYWPRAQVSPAYERLELARQGRWSQFLQYYYAF